MSIIIDGKSLRDHIKHLRRQTFLLNKKVKNLSSASTGTSSSLMAAPTSLGANIAISSIPHKDEDNMASNSVAHLATQQSIKAYADTKLPLAGGTLSGTLTVGVDDTGYDVKFFGDTTLRYMLWDTSDDSLKLPDSTRLKIGTGEDLQIYHDGSNSYIRDTATGSLFIQGDNIYFRKDDFVDYMASFIADGAVNLYYNNVKKFETTSAGATVTGALTVTTDIDVDGTANLDAVDIDGAVQLDGTLTVGVNDTGYDVKLFGATSGKYMLWDESADSLKLTDTTNLDAGTGLRLYTDANGHAVIYALGQDKDLYLVGDDGGTGINALVFDMSDHGKASFNGQVNIGNPGYTSSNPDGYMKGAGNNGTAGSRFQVTANSSDNTRRLWLGTSHTEAAITITENKVGIGTTTLIPAATLLHLFDSAPELRIQDGGDKASNASGYLSFYDHDSLMMNFGVNDGGAAELNLVNNAAFTFKTNNSVALTLNASQNATFAAAVDIETGINLESGTLIIKNATGDSSGLRIFQDSSDASKIYNNYNGTLQLGVGNTTAITIDSSENTTFAGNVAVGGGALKTYHSNVTSVIELDDQASIFTRANETYIGQNIYYDSGDDGTAIEAGKGTLMRLRRGEINMYFSAAAASSADDTHSLQEKFTLTDAGALTIAGTLGVGGSNPGDRQVYVTGSAAILELESTTANNNASIWFKSNVSGTSADRWELGTNISQTSSFELYNRLAGTSAFHVNSSNNTAFTGTVSHKGLDIADGTGAQIDTKETFDLNLDFVANTWIDTGIYSNSGSYQLGSSGTYIMQIYSNDHSPGEPYWYGMYWSAIISWYKGTGNQAVSYPITLQRAGHSDNNRVLEAQITNTTSSGSPANELRLELKTTSTASSTDISIRFRRLL